MKIWRALTVIALFVSAYLSWKLGDSYRSIDFLANHLLEANRKLDVYEARHQWFANRRYEIMQTPEAGNQNSTFFLVREVHFVKGALEFGDKGRVYEIEIPNTPSFNYGGEKYLIMQYTKDGHKAVFLKDEEALANIYIVGQN